MNKRKIVVLVSSLKMGGAENVAAALANHWAQSGAEVIVVTWASSDGDFYKLDSAVARKSLDQSDSNFLLRTYRRLVFLAKIIRSEQPDFCIGIMWEQATILAVVALLYGGICVGSERSHPLFYSVGFIRNSARKLACAYMDAVVCLTNRTADWYQKNTLADRIFVIPNALPWPMKSGKPVLTPPASARCGASQYLAIAVGRLCHEKGFDRLLRAFAIIASRHRDWTLVLLGEGEKRQDLEAQINAAGLSGQVRLVGRVGNLTDWYVVADLLVSASRVEGFPNVLVEAMGHGCPCLAFDCDTGPSDIITSGVDGELVPEGDVVALAAKMDVLMGDDALRARYASAALAVRERFSEKHVYQMWDALFHDLNPPRI